MSEREEEDLTEFGIHLEGGGYVEVTSKYQEPAQLWDAIQKTVKAAGLINAQQRTPFFFPEAVVDGRAVLAVSFVFDEDEGEEEETFNPKSFSGGI